MSTLQPLDEILDTMITRFPGSGIGVEVPDATELRVLTRNGRQPIPAASTSKIVIAMALVDAAESGDIDIHETIRIGDLPQSKYASVLKDLNPNRQLSLQELCNLALSISDNPSTQAILERIGKPRIMALLKNIGTSQTTMESGYSPEDLQANIRRNMTSVEDTLGILRYLKCERYSGLRRALANSRRNTRIPYELDEDLEVSHKTGSLRGLVHDVGLIKISKHIEISVVFLVKHENEARQAEDAIGQATLNICNIVAGTI